MFVNQVSLVRATLISSTLVSLCAFQPSYIPAPAGWSNTGLSHSKSKPEQQHTCLNTNTDQKTRQALSTLAIWMLDCHHTINMAKFHDTVIIPIN